MDLSLVISTTFIAVAMCFGHCPFMCGPLCAALPRPLAYHAGRSAVYLLLCVTCFFLSKALGFSRFSAAMLLFVTGCFLMLLSVALALRGRLLELIENRRLSSKICAQIAPLIASKSAAASLLAGALNGLLPCGVVYYFAAAASQAKNLQIALFYGLLLALCTSLCLQSARLILRAAFWRFLAPALIFLQGAFLAFKGLSLA